MKRASVRYILFACGGHVIEKGHSSSEENFTVAIFFKYLIWLRYMDEIEILKQSNALNLI